MKVPVFLSPLNDATKEQLTSEINKFTNVKSLRGKIDFKFEDNSFAESGIADKYRQVGGQVVVQSPANIYLQILVPVTGQDFVDMTSDGTKFCVAIPSNYVEEKYRRFACGTNSADYTKLRKEMTSNDGQSKQVKAFSSLRPQHFTDALLMREVKSDETTTYLQSEIYQDETDATKPSSQSARVIRGYYLLDELKKKENGELEISRRFWFDRVGGIRLARQQIFDDKSAVVSDIAYGAIQKFGANGETSLPVKVEVTRPQERYKVSLTYQSPQTVTVGQVFDPQVFQLINKWNLPEVDLDKSPTK